MGWEAPWHWVVLAVIVIALFGYKKLPDAARSLGRSLRIFKTEIKGMGEDDKARDAAKESPPAAIAAPPLEKNDTNGATPTATAQTEKPANSAQ
ncbi:MAG: Sec-independent protein translocase subunit TatA [Pseudonocardiales bacterium]